MAISKEQRAELVRKEAVETTVEDFLDLDEADMKIVEFRVRLAREVRRRRLAARISQKTLAGRMKVSQPRIPEIESGRPPASNPSCWRSSPPAGVSPSWRRSSPR